MSNEPLLASNGRGDNSPSVLSPTAKLSSPGLTLRTTTNNPTNNPTNNRSALLGTSIREVPTTFKRPGVLGAVKNMVLKPLTHEPKRKERLLAAIEKGNTEEALRIIQTTKIDLDAVLNKDGNTALIIASQRGYLDIVKALIAAGADVNAASKDGNTALTVASSNGHLEVVKALIAKRADVNAADKDGNTALIGASQYGHHDIMKALIAAGANVNAVSESSFTALMGASYYGSLEMVKALIAAGADVNAANRDGKTALIGASHYGHLEVVKALIAAGAKKKGLLFGFRGGRKTRKNKLRRKKATRHRR